MFIAFAPPIAPESGEPAFAPQREEVSEIWQVLWELLSAALFFGPGILWEHATGKFSDLMRSPWQEQEEWELGIVGTCTLLGIVSSILFLSLATAHLINESPWLFGAALFGSLCTHTWALSRIGTMP